MSQKPPVDDPVLLATIGGAHGIRGEVRVRSFTQDPEDVGAYGPLFDAKGNRYTVKSAREQKTVVVVRFAEIGDRVIVVAGVPFGIPGATNMVRIAFVTREHAERA